MNLDQMIEALTSPKNNDKLTRSQDVGGNRERWDIQWEVEQLEKKLAERDAEIGSLRYEKMMLKAELNAIRGKKGEAK